MYRITTRTTTAALVAATLLLTGCAGGGADPAAVPTVTATSTVTPSTGASPTGTGTPTPAPVASIPTDCTDVVDAETYEETFGDVPLNAQYPEDATSGRRTPTQPPADADLQQIMRAVPELRCTWFDPRSDVTSLVLDLGRVTAEQGATITTEAAASGSTCEEVHGGTSCQQVRRDEQYPIDVADTYFVRDGVVVHVHQANYPTDDLLGDVTERLWGSEAS